MKTKKQILIKFGITIIVFCVIFIVASVIKVKAKTTDTGSGWLWGGSEDANIVGTAGVIDGNETGAGWISMNSSYCDNNNSGFSDGASGCPAAGTLMADYGVNIPSNDGPVTGYAWSPNLGYIDFDPQDHCIAIGNPSAGKYKAHSCTSNSDGTRGGVTRSGNSLTGWARIVDIAKESFFLNSGGWQGWIKMNGTAKNGSNYGVSVSGNTLNGKAWNGEEIGIGNNTENGIGWIDFSRSTTICNPSYSGFNWLQVPTSTPTCTQATCNTTITTANYVCTAIDANNCGEIPPASDCIANLGNPPTDPTSSCPPCSIRYGTWKEVSPQ